MTQTDFGKVLGVNRSGIANIELNVLANPAQKEPLYRLICKEFSVRYEWLMTGEEPMQATPEEDVKADLMRQVADVFKLDGVDRMWLKILLELDAEGKAELKAAALRIAKIAATFTSDTEAGEEIVADTQAAHDKAFALWDRDLTKEEYLALAEKRYDDAKGGAV